MLSFSPLSTARFTPKAAPAFGMAIQKNSDGTYSATADKGSFPGTTMGEQPGADGTAQSEKTWPLDSDVAVLSAAEGFSAAHGDNWQAHAPVTAALYKKRITAADKNPGQPIGAHDLPIIQHAAARGLSGGGQTAHRNPDISDVTDYYGSARRHYHTDGNREVSELSPPETPARS